jgi:hypothetical protein
LLVYLATTEGEFIGRAELATAVHDWTPAEAEAYPSSGVTSLSVRTAYAEEQHRESERMIVETRVFLAELARARPARGRG